MTDKQPEAQGYGIWDTNIDGKRIMGFTPGQWFDREKEHNVAIERKDALLRQALEAMRLAVDDDYLLAAVRSMVAITKELAK